MPSVLKAVSAAVALVVVTSGALAQAQTKQRLEIIIAELGDKGGRASEELVFRNVHPRLEYLRGLIKEARGRTEYIHIEQADRPVTGDSSIQALWEQNSDALALLWGQIDADQGASYGLSSIELGSLESKAAALEGQERFTAIDSVFEAGSGVTADMHLYIVGYALLLDAWYNGRPNMVCPILTTMRSLYLKLDRTDSGSAYLQPILAEVGKYRRLALDRGSIKPSQECARFE